MNDVVNCLAQRGLDIREIRLSGGGARSDFWRQMQADIYAIKCVTINAEEGPAYGAALLAATGAGEFATIAEACQAGIDITRTIEPDARAVQAYKPFYEQFGKLYPALKDQFAKIAQL
jgi:xylulokinase